MVLVLGPGLVQVVIDRGQPPDPHLHRYGLSGCSAHTLARVSCSAITAARLFSPSLVIAIDLASSRLEAAKTFGADVVINVDTDDVIEKVMEATSGKGVDVSVDCTAGAGTFPILLGIEALTAECFVAAARAGVVDEVAASLKNNYPGLDWAKVVPYNLERMASHGERRAAEMEEVADTLRELGVEPLMTTATVKRQREMGQIGTQQLVRGVLKKDRAAMLNAISAAARDRH